MISPITRLMVTAIAIVFPAVSRNPATQVVPVVVPTVSSDSVAERESIYQDSIAGLRWMVTGHRDWSRYTHPAQCLAAIEIVQHDTFTRTNWVHPRPQGDTLSDLARTIGRTCAAKFSPPALDERDQLDYLRLALTLDDLPLATAIVDTRLTRAKTPDEKGSVIADAVQTVLGRFADQTAWADSLVSRITTFGPKASWWALVALSQLPRFATPFDTARLAQIDRQFAARYQAATRDDRMKAGVVTLSEDNAWFQLHEFRRLPSEHICALQRQASLNIGPDSIRGINGQLMASADEMTCLPYLASVGKPVAPLPSADWFTPGDTIPSTTLGYPMHGHVTLILNAPVGAGRPPLQLAIARRLYEQYGKDGLDIVLIQQRQGFLWGSGLLSPATETRLIRWYNHDYLKLPFPIAVYDTAAGNLPETMLIGRDGRRYASNAVTDNDQELVLEAFVKQALHTQGISTQ